MAQLLVRNLDDDVKARPRVLAAEHGRGMEEDVGLSCARPLCRRCSRPAALELKSLRFSKSTGW